MAEIFDISIERVRQLREHAFRRLKRSFAKAQKFILKITNYVFILKLIVICCNLLYCILIGQNVNSISCLFRERKRYSSHTVNAYHTDLHQFKVYLELQYSILNLNEVKYNYVRSWIASLSIKSIDNRSIHRKISSLKSYYNWAIRYKYIDQSPIEKVISPKLKKRLPEVIQKEKYRNYLI